MTTPEPLPDDAESVIYYHEACKGKATFGAAYVREVGLPTTCPNCGQSYSDGDHGDRVTRIEGDTDADLIRKRDAVFQRRGDRVPATPKPTDPREIRRQRIRELREQLRALEDADDADGRVNDPVRFGTPIIGAARPPGVRLGP